MLQWAGGGCLALALGLAAPARETGDASATAKRLAMQRELQAVTRGSLDPIPGLDAKRYPEPSRALAAPHDEAPLVLTVDLAELRQTVHGFGASDAWATPFVGTEWPVAARAQLADWLFSLDFDAAGNPKGIGLSWWRFYLGAGSARQEHIQSPWRRSDTFGLGDGTYDWDRLPGPRWFLDAAWARGVRQLLMFCCSPPLALTRNGKGFADPESESNLKTGEAAAFAGYLADVLEHFETKRRRPFALISPINEPNWDWDSNGQEGSPYSNAGIQSLVEALHAELEQRSLAAEISIPEAGMLTALYEGNPQRTQYLPALFRPGSRHYVGDKVAPHVAAHSYFTDWVQNDTLIGTRERLRRELSGLPGLEYWMTEFCIYIPHWAPRATRQLITGHGRDSGMDTSLWTARLMHADLTVADAAAWFWWLAVSKEDYKDGLVYVDPPDQAIHDSKLLWSLGHFSRFVRPGMRRVELSRSDAKGVRETLTGLMPSAYFDPVTGTLSVVLVNVSRTALPVQLRFSGFEGGRTVSPLVPFVTTGMAGENLTRYRNQEAIRAFAVPPRGLVTLVGRVTAGGVGAGERPASTRR